jgi:hypothetical protein
VDIVLQHGLHSAPLSDVAFISNVLNPRASVAPRIAYVLCYSNIQGHSKVEVQSSCTGSCATNLNYGRFVPQWNKRREYNGRIDINRDRKLQLRNIMNVVNLRSQHTANSWLCLSSHITFINLVQLTAVRQPPPPPPPPPPTEPGGKRKHNTKKRIIHKKKNKNK